MTLRLQRVDRRRLAVASALTVFALPAVWLANRDDRPARTRPNVAAVGLAAEDAPRRRRAADATAPPTSVDPMGTHDPLFTREPTGHPRRGRVSAVVGRTDTAILATPLATYSRSVAVDACAYNGLPAGTEVTVVNPANGRSLECLTSPNDEDEDELTLHPDRFVLIADLTAGPVSVELHGDR